MSLQDETQVVHGPARLHLDALRKRAGVVVVLRRHLPGEQHPAVGLDGVAERCHRRRRGLEHVKDRLAHAQRLTRPMSQAGRGAPGEGAR